MSVTIVELQSLPLFEGCAPEDLRPVIDAVSGIRDAVEGEVICAEGEKADRWWIVVDGMADVTVGGLYTATIGPGETIGELALLDGEPRGATVKAATGMRLHEVDGDVFLDALLTSPRLAVALLRQLATRLRETNLLRQGPLGAAPVSASVRPPRPASPTEHPVQVESRVAHLLTMREAAAVQWSETLSSYVVTRYRDVYRLCRDHSFIGSVATLDPSYVAAPARSSKPRPGHRMMMRMDGADHVRLRRLLSKAFTPRAVGRWQERAESIVARLLDEADERTELDVIADYALPLSAQLISEMLGMPRDDVPQLSRWSRTLTTCMDPLSTPEEEEAYALAWREMSAYVQQVIVDKRAHRSNDILTALLVAEEAGEVLSDDEVLAQVLLLYIAGYETTLNLIGNGVTHLLRFPEQLDRLRAEPGLDANAVEEVLRFESPAQLTRRVSLEPVEIDGVTIPAGNHITISLAAANHDPRKWGPTAGVLDVARSGANEHVSFGGGPHFCLGASLSRLEGRIALPTLLRRFPHMAPAYDEPRWIPRLAVRGVETLPVTLRQ